MATVYVIFSSLDRGLAEMISIALSNYGHRVLNKAIDSTSALSGGVNARYVQASHLITQAEVVLVLMTANATRSVLMNREVTYATAQGQLLLPVRLDGSDIPPHLTMYQALDARGLDQASVATQLDSMIREYTRVPEATARLQAAPEAAPNTPAMSSLRSAAPTATTSGADYQRPLPPPQAVPRPSPVQQQPSYPPVSAPKAGGPARPLVLVGLTLLLIVLGAAGVIMLTSNAGTSQVTVRQTEEAAIMTNTMVKQIIDLTNTAKAFTLTPSYTPTQNPGQVTVTVVSIATALPPVQPAAPNIADIVAATTIALRATDESSISPAEAAIIASGAAIRADQSQQMLIALLFILTLASVLLSVGLSLILAFSGRYRGRRVAHPQRVAHPTTAHPNLLPPLLQTYQIFISSSERDREWVTRFVDDLGALGYLVWWYAKDAPGLPFGKEIRSAIFYTKLFVVVITPDSMASEHVEEEIRWADTFKRPIVPLEVRETPVQDRHYGLAKGATINFTDPREYDSALDLLTQAFSHHLTLAEQAATLIAPSASTGPTAPSPATAE